MFANRLCIPMVAYPICGMDTQMMTRDCDLPKGSMDLLFWSSVVQLIVCVMDQLSILSLRSVST